MADTEEGRITLAVLGAKMDMMMGKLDVLCNVQGQDHDRVQILVSVVERNSRRIDTIEETVRDVNSDRLDDLEEHIDRVDSRDRWFSGINGVAVMIAGILGWIR